jgi:hypothetical protein
MAAMIVYRASRQITVYELMEMLKRCKPEAFVTVEGCDCIGECEGLTDDADGVMIARRRD